MDEEKPKEAVVEGKPAEDTTERLQQETTTELDRADQIAERQKRENDRREALLKREEALEARRRIGGRSEGAEPKEKPKVLTDTEYAEALQRGEVNPLKDDGFIK